jgi:hypothetical protein
VDVHHGFDRTELAVKLKEAGYAPPLFDTVFEIVEGNS